MDSKKIIEKLLKIAANQQKIIMKLAQAQGQELSGQHLDPAKTQKDAAGALRGALKAAPVGKFVSNVQELGSDMLITFSPGQATQPNYNAVMAVMQDLTNKNILQHAYNLKVV